MPLAVTSRSARQLRASQGRGSCLLFLSLAIVFHGDDLSLPLLQFSSPSSVIAPRFYSAVAAAALDAPITADTHTTTKEWQVKRGEEIENEDKYPWSYDEVIRDDRSIGDGNEPPVHKRKLVYDIEFDAPDLDLHSVDEPSTLLEGCLIPAHITSVEAKHGRPLTGNVAENSVDGDPSTWWARRGRSRWLEVEFNGGEDSDSVVEGVAVAFYKGNRRIAFFDMTLYNEDDNIVSKRENIESGGLTPDYEEFYFDEPVEGSRVRLDFKGTTAGQWNAIAEVSVCLQRTKTPAPVTPATESPAPSSGLTYVGCFMDDDTGTSRYLGDIRMQDSELTPLTCAAFCSGYKYMGLQYSKDCFCGNTYYTAERDPVPTDQCTMPCAGDTSLICGGAWANSIFVVGDPATMTAEELEAINAPRVDDGMPRRQFTVFNSCSEQIRLGATGGFVKAIEDPLMESCPGGSVLDEHVGACFWGLPLPEDGKTYDIEPGGYIEIVFDHVAVGGVRWSGNMWASTGCHTTVGCETGSCLRNTGYPDGFCPPSTGPTGPVTKAEFTLVDTGVDYYDITTIDGVNLPMEMKPDERSEPLKRLEDPYWCSNPGGLTSMSEGLDGCSWEFDPSRVEGFTDNDMSSYLRWVRNDGLFSDCEVDSDCDSIEGEAVGEDLRCGLLFGQDALNGGVTEEMFPKKCGSSLGWHSANGICGNSHGKPLGYFPNSYPFMCEVRTNQVAGDNSTQSDLYKCAGQLYGLSGYSRNAEDTACGCPDWVAEGINAPSESVCYGSNPYWDSLSLPWLMYLKRACPTAYCFPYDDHSSTFVCRNEDLNNDHQGQNSMSYMIDFCPGDSQVKLLG